jgi:hypothetical protein
VQYADLSIKDMSLATVLPWMLGFVGLGLGGVMSDAVFFLYLTGSTYWAIIQDTVRGENIGGVGGFVHAVANCAGIIGPAMTGFIVQATGAFTSAFVLAGAIATPLPAQATAPSVGRAVG